VRGANLGDVVPIPTGEPGAIRKLAKSNEELRTEQDQRRDDQPLVTLCQFCDWRHEGTVGEGRAAALEHRQAEHPDAIGKTFRRRRIWVPRSRRTAEEDESVGREADEHRRARHEREQAEMLEKVLRRHAREAAA
jgi:hypothetical protein